MNTRNTLIISATILLSVLAILYFQFYTTTMKLNEQKVVRLQDVTRNEQIRQDQIMQRTNCLTGAFKDYATNWQSQAKQLGRTDNLLPTLVSERLDKDYQTDQELCVKKFPL